MLAVSKMMMTQNLINEHQQTLRALRVGRGGSNPEDMPTHKKTRATMPENQERPADTNGNTVPEALPRGSGPEYNIDRQFFIATLLLFYPRNSSPVSSERASSLGKSHRPEW